MPKRSRKTSDPNSLATSIVGLATGDDLDGKDPAAVALGRRGGLKGGPARAKAMTAKERSESAKKAAQTRWGKTRRV